MFYRLNQLYYAVFARVEPREHLWLKTILKPTELALFYRQALPEQRHALDVANDIKHKKNLITIRYGEQAYVNLLLAALLHDCGKSVSKLLLWQRVFIVLALYLPGSWKQKITSRKNFLSKTLLIHKRHPVWGKRLAAKAGLNMDVQILIQNHHTPATPLEHLLFQADNSH